MKRACIAILIFALVGCEASTAVNDVSGDFTLFEYDGHALPAVIAPIPSTGLDGAQRPGCNLVVDSGALEFVGNGKYRATQLTKDSCTGRALGEPVDSGVVRQIGDSLSFSVPGNAMVLWGRRSGETITLHYPTSTLRFRR